MMKKMFDIESDELVEKISEEVHKAWAAGRIEDGWIYGTEMSLKNKTTPWLISYDELPESEKEVDRRTVRQVVRALSNLGYIIKKQDEESNSGN